MLITHVDLLEERSTELDPDTYALSDLPGRVELSTRHENAKNIVKKLTLDPLDVEHRLRDKSSTEKYFEASVT